jgi:APA family basic amino acid/polyamine antiporter
MTTETNAQASKPALKQGVGLVGVTMLGAGTAIGVSIFSVLAPAAQIAGSGLLLAAVLAAIPMVFYATSYAYLSSVLPKSGASYEWPRRFLHPSVGFLIAWMRILGSVGAMTVLATVLVNYLNSMFSLPEKPTIAGVLTAVFLLNYFGVKSAARVQTILMCVLLAVFAIFVFSGATAPSVLDTSELLAGGWVAVFACVPLMISLFMGIEAAVEIGEEVRTPQKTIPQGIALAILLTLVVYLSVSWTALKLVGAEALAGSGAPILDAAQVTLGTYAAPLVLGAASVAILKTLNSTAIIFSRSLFAMGRAGAFPAALGKVHPTRGTPHVAILVAYVCAMTGLFMPSSLVFLLLAVNIPTMLKYMACSLCSVRVVDAHPDLAATARMKLSPLVVRICGYVGVVAAILIIAAGFEADWRPYALILGWSVVGIVYWIIKSRRSGAVPADQVRR